MFIIYSLKCRDARLVRPSPFGWISVCRRVDARAVRPYYCGVGLSSLSGRLPNVRKLLTALSD